VTALNLGGATLTNLRSGGLAGAPSTLPAGWSAADGYLVGPHANLASADFQGAFAVNASFAWAALTHATFSNAPPQLPLAPPTVANGTAYLSVAGEGIVAISGGKLLWQSQTSDSQGSNVLGLSAPTFANGVLYATAGLYGVFAIDAASGAQLLDAVPAPWPGSAQQSTQTCGSPAVSGGVLYLACTGGYVYAMSAATGKTLWSGSELVYACNATTGKKLWTYSAGNTLQSTPVAANGLLYIGTGTGGMAALRPK
jgi:outer membrane protein assembly factor BamB